MSAIGTKRTCELGQQMSAIGGKADIAYSRGGARSGYVGKADIALVHCTCPLMTQSGHIKLG